MRTNARLHVHMCTHVDVDPCVHAYVYAYVCMCTNMNMCACACHAIHKGLREMHPPVYRSPPLGKAHTFREMPSSENLLQRALKGLVSSSASLGSSRSVPLVVPSARRSVPTSRRPSRCSAEPSRGRI